MTLFCGFGRNCSYICEREITQLIMTIMKRLSLIIALTMLAMASQAQLLWKVNGSSLARPSYILGTYHLAPVSMLDEIPGFDQALEGCDVVVGELDKEEMKNPGGLMSLASTMMAPADSTLDKLFTPQELQVIEQVFNKYCGAIGLPFSLLGRLKPEAVNMLITQMRVSALDTDNTNYIDMGVQYRGAKLGRPSMGLETMREQAELMFNSPIAEQAKRLLEACEDDDVQDEMSQALKQAYMSQDLVKLEEVFRQSAGDNWGDARMDALLTHRNINWVEKLVKIMPERACLVCVGAGHLLGDKGLLQLLRDQGYTVEPVQ